MTKQNFNITLRSANQSKLWLAHLRDSKRLDVDDVEWLLQEVGEISNGFASSIQGSSAPFTKNDAFHAKCPQKFETQPVGRHSCR